MKPPLGRVIIGLLMIAGIFAAYGLFMWAFGAWTHKLVYEDHNDLAVALIAIIILGGVCVVELWTKGEIPITKNFSLKPRWGRKAKNLDRPTDAGKVLELRPDEYRERH